MLKAVPQIKPLKEIERDGFKVTLLAEDNLFRVNAVHSDGSYPRTRLFSNYEEACDLFDSYVKGN